MKLKDGDLGFDPYRVVLIRLSPSAGLPAMSAETRQQIYDRILERAGGVPGVDRASGSFTGVLSSELWRNVIAVDGFVPPDGRTPRAFVNAVTPSYFDVMRIAFVRGRAFTARDRGQAPEVAIVNAAFVRQFLAGRHPIGARVALCTSEPCDPNTGTMEVVGVAADAKYANLKDPAPPIVYVPFAQHRTSLNEIQVRAVGDVAAVVPTLHRELTGVDRRLTVVAMLTARDRVDQSLAAENMVAAVSSAFGLLALALAAVGLCGLVAYTTSQRTHEIGVRMALGARHADVRRLVLGHSFRLVLLGAALGVPGAFALAQLVSGLLYEVEPFDPLVLAASGSTLLAVALVAALVPAARAARVDPMKALRAE
jgi:predicted permease